MVYVDLAARFLHLLSMAALIGGTLFMLAAMLPAMKLLDDSLKQSIIALARKRFMRIAHPAIALLILTGAWQWYRNVEIYRASNKALQGVLGMKVLIAMVIFGLIFAGAFGVLKGCPRKWAKITLALAIVVVILAAVVRAMRLGQM
ncbi:MAG: hypothetical protein GC162_10130 [Planctomycetes bacterium]|nr:hypothetical protein [Planctomycetota bacterium]